MTCYFRHLGPAFEAAGVEVTRESRPRIHEAVIAALGTDAEQCPDVWREVKAAVHSDEAAFVARLRTAWQQAPRA